MKKTKNKFFIVALIALVDIALALTLVILLSRNHMELPAGTDGTTQTTEPVDTLYIESHVP